MKKVFLFLFTLVPANLLPGAVLTTLPTPVNQGGMIHINFSLDGFTLAAVPEAGTPVIQPLSAWKPGDSLDASAPWYSTLDPTQEAASFNSQFGFVIDAGNSDPLPVDSKVLISWVSGTTGLEAYRWKNTEPQAFEGILGTDGSPGTWDWSSVSHGMMHPLFAMPAGFSGAATATLSFTLADSSNVPLSGYNTAQATLNFTVVPEPSVLGISAGALLLFGRRRRSDAMMS